MGAELLLYGYGLVCLSMLGFNLIYALLLRGGDRRMERRVSGMDRLVNAQLQRLQTGRPVEKSHLSRMDRTLSRVRGLLAFDQYLDQISPEDPAFQQYLSQMQPLFLHLAAVYRRRESTQPAYFCHVLTKLPLPSGLSTDPLPQIILSYMERDDLYCRVNALKALCSFGGAEPIVQALQLLSREPPAPLHSKVIVETLLYYKGCMAELIQMLWDTFPRYSTQVQRAILDFIRFQGGNCGPEMLKILADGSRSKELRFAAIRYFGRYSYAPALPLLLEFVRDLDPLRWEYAAISASALARYSGQEVVDALMLAMHSPNWYVRFNAAGSLEAHGLSYADLLEVIGGSDRYAREMLLYRLEIRRQRESLPESAADAAEEVTL